MLGAPDTPAMEAMFTIEPGCPPSPMTRAAAWSTVKTPVTLTARTVRRSSRS